MRSNRITCACLVCGTEFLEKPSRIADGKGKYCSRPCTFAGRINRYEVSCEVCGTSFTTHPSRTAKGGGRFCSKTCEGRGRTTAITRACKQCGASLTATPSEIANGQGVYCSLKCRDDARRGSEAPWARKEPNCICETCGGPFRMGPGLKESGRGRFCSNTCKATGERTPVIIPNDERDLIYLAAFIDGEGTITIMARNSVTTGRESMRGVVMVANSFEPVMRWIKDTFGGNISNPRSVRSIKHKPVMTWFVGSSQAVLLCKHLLPYLKIKRRQAEIVIELSTLGYTTGGQQGRTVDEATRTARTPLLAEIRKLNHRGVPSV